MLAGADRRSIGRANQVVRVVLKDSGRFRELIECLWSENPIIRMRAADAAEKVSSKRPELLQRHKPQLLGLLAETTQIELRWHLSQMIPRLRLTPDERQRAATALRLYLDDCSSIVRTWAVDAIVRLSKNDASLRPDATQLLEDALRSGTAAMKARARNLLKNLQPE